jgi:heat shock protein HslJ/uncharacterized lipoprotein YbaY
MTLPVKTRLLRAWLVAALAAGCATAVPLVPASVAGTATYRERMALPPEAVFEASIEDAARPDGAAPAPLGATRVTAPRVPIDFAIGIDAGKIQPGHRYVLHSRITLDGQPLFIAETPAPALAPGTAARVEVLLHRAGDDAQAGATRRIQGLYRYVADSPPAFVDCADGRRLAVAREGDNPALQAAYLAARPVPGDALLATVDARVLARHSGEDRQSVRPTLVVDRFVAISTQVHCDSPVGTAPLENTDWTLVALRGKALEPGASQRPPGLVLQSGQRRLAGSGGCNHLAGRYTLQGDRLTLGQAVAARTACPHGMAQEQAYLDALAVVARWRIDNQRLALLDARGSVVAEFETKPAQ